MLRHTGKATPYPKSIKSKANTYSSLPLPYSHFFWNFLCSPFFRQRTDTLEISSNDNKHSNQFSSSTVRAVSAVIHCSGKKKKVTHPHEAGGKPSFFIIDLTPPPVLVGSIQDLDNVSCFKRQLPVGHGDVIPYCLSTYNRTTTDQLWKQKTSSQ